MQEHIRYSFFRHRYKMNSGHLSNFYKKIKRKKLKICHISENWKKQKKIIDGKNKSDKIFLEILRIILILEKENQRCLRN